MTFLKNWFQASNPYSVIDFGQTRTNFENNLLLHEDQHGFRAGRSCHLALNTFVDYAKHELDSKKHVIAIFLDFSKAFETIDHQLLLIKLEKYGFSQNALELITNYLKNRFSLVSFDGKFSPRSFLNLEYHRVQFQVRFCL